jgi:spore cortex formation protein SpoVR/YcgB (stage V sporulation)
MNTISRQSDLLFSGSDWDFETLSRTFDAIERVAAEELNLDIYPVQMEIISSEQMLDAYSSIGMPLMYRHWSFGKHFLYQELLYRKGSRGLAYEIVINSNPCIAYLMEENSLTMQALVIAHAAYGHNSFFKGNYLFRTWTDASSIIDYLLFAKNYLRQCEERHGVREVEAILDSCHALMNYGVDRYKRPYPISAAEETLRQEEREAALQKQVNDLWRTIPFRNKKEEEEARRKRWPEEPQENILYFVEKNAPLLEPWQREVVRIVRKIAQYFYPQRQTQVMNEGWATFWHYTLLNHMYDEGLVTDGFMLEFLQSHTAVVYQPPFDSPYYRGINPYALGYTMFQDIKRICENPTEEDRRWFPDIAGSPWLATLKFAMQSFKDESFVQQFLSPRVMREFKMFAILDNDQRRELEVSAIHDDSGFRRVRQALSNQYNLSMNEPNIQVWNVNRHGDRSLTLRHVRHDRRPLGDSAADVLKHLHRLWKFDVHLESYEGNAMIERTSCTSQGGILQMPGAGAP